MKINKSIITIVLLLLIVSNLYSQSTIAVESSDYAIVMQTDELNRLKHTYFGKRLANSKEYNVIGNQLQYNGKNEDLYNHAYTPSGTWNIAEPALSISHADKNPSTELDYVSHKTTLINANVNETVIYLVDSLYKTEVELHYKVYQKENVFEQWSVITNREKKPIELKKYASANLYFRNKDFYLTQYHGTWATEMQPETHKLTAGIKVLDSKLGTRANLYSPPTFMLSFDGIATEDKGKVLLANLAWSGNFRFDFEKGRYDNLRLIAGINSHASEYELKPEKTFITPSFIYSYSENGKGEASRNMHDWARKYRVLDGEGDRLTLLNNWEATYFDFDEHKIVELFDGAKKIGVDLFLLDDGWFANKYPRNGDNAGLGDWEENKKKLPHGINYLVEKATSKGIKFGIWIEPEMINPKSELYETHLDWVIRQPNRKEYYYRNQLVLDMSNPDVQNYVYNVFDNMMSKNPGISYIKWDCNSMIYNAYSKYLEKSNLPQTQLYVDYVKGFYNVMKRLRKKYPLVPVMLCSGGGGRVDYEALQYFTEFWVSDNTAPIDRVFMHWNYSLYYPAITMSAHVTEWDKTSSIKYRTDVASMGKLGFDIEVDQLSKDEIAFCKEAVKNYDNFSDVLFKGNQYRLQSPYENPFASFQFVDKQKERSIMFSYLISNKFEINYSIEPVILKGLNPLKNYRIKELNLFPNTSTTIDETVIYSGDYLMKIGYNPKISQKRKSVVLEIYVVN